MSGGYCGNMWPACRGSQPKQFLHINGSSSSLIREAWNRCLKLVPPENILVVALQRHKDKVKREIPELLDENLLLEPYGRHTGPCVAFATYTLLKRNPDAVTAFVPSDQRISDDGKFRKTLLKAFDYVEMNPVLLTIGVTPDKPGPSFGYIQVLGGKDACMVGEPVKVKTFTEKPDMELAKVFCESGEFYWNSGIFVWRADVIREEMEACMPEVTNLFNGWEGALGTSAEKDFINTAYSDCIKISIDNGVMEKTERAWMCLAEFGWSDVDNWATYYANCRKTDAGGNATNTRKQLMDNASGNLVVSRHRNKLVAIKGLKDYVVVDTDDVLLICPNDDESYKSIMSKLALPGYEKYK